MKQGYGIFGKAYEVMLRNDLHAIRSIDHAFLRQMILLDHDSKDHLYASVHHRDLRKHELFAFAQPFRAPCEKETVQNMLQYTSEAASSYRVPFEHMLFGGTEKQIIQRGTDWCADMTRVGAVLLMCLGISCRIVHLANVHKAYHGHVLGETFYDNRHGLVDFIYGYQFYSDTPVSAWDMLVRPVFPATCDEQYKGLFSAIAINEYNPSDPHNDYTVSGPNDYYKTLIAQDHHGRWLMGEDG